jgi:transcriptional regulator with PAS, ATPase and Fis domain
MGVLLVAPYPDLVKTAEETLKNSPFTGRVVLGDLNAGLEAARKEINNGNADVVVSRGGTASLLRQNLTVPVFEIDVTGFDLIRAIYPHVQRNRRIAVVGYENVVSGARRIAEILSADLGYFLVDATKHIEEVVREARDWGADVVVGDTISINTARNQGLQCELVRSGPEAIRSTVEAAAQFMSHMREEVLRNKRLNMIMDHADRGVLYLAADDRVELMNKQSERILQTAKDQLVGLTLTAESVPKELALAVKNREQNQLIHLNGRDYIVEVVEIQNEGYHAATLVFLQSSGRIRNLEGLIRKQLVSRGLVATYHFDTMSAYNPLFRKTLEKAHKFSRTDSTILLLGETGSGKEVFAQSIHNASLRNDGPFVAVNCAALPDSLLESELFGYAEGAFTGARKGGKPGLFEMAHNGTIFLDEVNDMSDVVQARFLRVLQEKQVMRVGDNRVYDVDVRVVAACNTDLYKETESGRFRKDLYYRLRILDIEIPALRQRPEDIVPLFTAFLHEFAGKYGTTVPPLPQRLIDTVLAYPWPGNVRQLRNFAEKTSVLFSIEQDPEETLHDLIRELQVTENGPAPIETEATTLKEIESSLIRDHWERNGRNISATARQLGIDRATVRKYL